MNAPAKPRRTQVERRAATRTALLEATIDCLVEYGYTHTTLQRIAQRAGVSRGAQTHHFPTKAALFAQALTHVSKRQIEDVLQAVARLPEGPERTLASLDMLWETHTGRLFEAALELWVAARTDAELRACLLTAERDVSRAIGAAAGQALGKQATQEQFLEALDTTLAAIRGLALLGAAHGDRSPALQRRWLMMRGRLAQLFSR